MEIICHTARISTHGIPKYQNAFDLICWKGKNFYDYLYIVSLALILNIVNPKILWNIDFWKYNGDKSEPSGTYIILNRTLSLIAFIVLWCVYFTRMMK